MAIQARISKLKLADDSPKSLGVGYIQPGVTCAEGLIENADYAVDYATSTVRRLRSFGSELYTFQMAYDDQSEVIAAQQVQLVYELTQRLDVRARYAASVLKNKTPAEIYTYLQGRIDGWGNLNAAKADLRVWLPLLSAVLAWVSMERSDQGQ